MTAENLLTQWARLLFSSLADAGVRTVVISPGSRSTPFAAAALAHPSLHCLSLIDERDAAFFALGRAKAEGVPSLVLCTSGTAGAHYLPAVLEAESSYSPLLILTADRPTELSHCHAPQTLDQVKLFGDHVRAFFELGAPEASPGALRALRRTAAQAVSSARGPLPGAVHLNARARKPLEPTPATSSEAEALELQVDTLLQTPITQAEPPIFALDRSSRSELIELIRSHERGLIVCGPAAASQGAAGHLAKVVARRSGYPLLVEAASQWRFFEAASNDSEPPLRVGAVDTLGRSPSLRRLLQPEWILQIGAPPTANGWSQYVEAHADNPRYVLHPHGWADPWSSARRILAADVGEALESILAELGGWERRKGSLWLEAWRQAEALAWNAANVAIEEAPEGLSEGLVARLVVESLPAGGGLALGNSLPIREVDAYSPPQPKPLAVWSQRGASGIDGVLAGAAGFAAALGRPAALLIGDVSFLHSLSGLAALRHLGAPFAVVVVNNGGGRIFEQLPIARQAEELGISLESWTTPHDHDLENAARLYQVPFRRVAVPTELRTALAEALAGDRPRVIEARVPSGGAAVQNRRLWQITEESIARELGKP